MTSWRFADRDVPLWVQALALTLISLAMAVLRLQYLEEPFERDLTSYAYISHYLLEGGKLYTQYFDIKPPGIYWAYMLSELAFGYGPQSVVCLGIFFNTVSLIFLFLLLRTIANVYTALAGSVLWAIASTSVTLEANLTNVEVPMNTFLLMALWSFARYRGGESRFLWLTGISVGVASAFKMIFVFPAAALSLYLILPLPREKPGVTAWLKSSSKKVAVLALPGLVIWTAIFYYFFVLGRFHDFWDAVFVTNSYYAGSIWLNVWHLLTTPELFFRSALKDVWVLVALSFAWPLFSRSTYGPISRSFLALMLAGILVEIASPGQYFPHYYQLLLPILTILSTLTIYDIAVHKRFKDNPAAGIRVAASVFLAALLTMASYQWSYSRMQPATISAIKYGSTFIHAYNVAMYVKEKTGPCDLIFEWGSETGIYFYSKRRASSTMFYTYPLSLGPKFQQQRRALRMFREVTTSPPAIFIWNKKYGELEKVPVFKDFIEKNYKPITISPPYTIFEHLRRDELRGDPDCN